MFMEKLLIFFIYVDLDIIRVSINLKEINFCMIVIQIIPFSLIILGLLDNYMYYGVLSDAEENITTKIVSVK